MNKDYDVVVVGGGVVGLLLAVTLGRQGFRLCLLDAGRKTQQAADNFDGRGYALSASSVRMFEALQIWNEVADQSQAIADIKVSDGRAGEGASPLFLHFDHRELEGGPFGYMLEDRYLRRALLAIAGDQQHIEIKHETDARLDAGTVTTEDGDTIDARLIIGCDGRQSGIAQAAGIGRVGWDYEQASIVCAVAHERPHDGIAHQFFTPAGPLAILPLPGDRSSIVWTENKARAASLMAADDAEFLAALKPVFGSFLGEISLEGQRFTYPLGLSIAQKFVTENVALVGDAAHGIHPLAGQGLNLGIRDVAALAEVLVEARNRGEDIAALNVLERYQQWRRFDTAGLAVATDGINKLFSNDNPILRAGRDIGLSLVGQMPALRRRLMREAAGLEGDLPRLLQGLPL